MIDAQRIDMIIQEGVELAGTGIRRMREAMIAVGLPPPRIRQTTFFNISFKRPMFDSRPAAVERKKSADKVTEKDRTDGGGDPESTGVRDARRFCLVSREKLGIANLRGFSS
jgi:predicted HTH transcriptional regulator